MNVTLQIKINVILETNCMTDESVRMKNNTEINNLIWNTGTHTMSIYFVVQELKI
jgi:hypothetical protein